MDGWENDLDAPGASPASSAAPPPLPRTIRRIVREELAPLIELVDSLRIALTVDRARVSTTEVEVGPQEGAQR